MPGISSSGKASPASTRIIPLPWRTAVMFLPISPKPPKGTTCKVSFSNSAIYLLFQAFQHASAACSRACAHALVLTRLCSRASVQVPPEVELLRPDGGEVHVLQIQVCSCEASYIFGAHRLDAGGDLLGSQQFRAGYDAPADAVHPRSRRSEERRVGKECRS